MRIKTLEELSDQRDRITDYLTEHNRYSTANKVDELFNHIFDNICDIIGISTIDEEAIELVFNEPVFVNEYQRLL